MKVKRLDNFSPFIDKKIVELESNIGVRLSYPKSLTDPTYYVPNREVNLQGSKLTDSNYVSGNYDYVGESSVAPSDLTVLARQRGLDVSEVSKIVDLQKSQVKESLENDKLEQSNKEKKQKDKLSTVDPIIDTAVNSSVSKEPSDNA